MISRERALRPPTDAKNLAQSYTDEAFPHEAGHILVGKTVGLPARGLDFHVSPHPDGGIIVGDFATLGFSPPDDQISSMDPKLKASYMLYVAGGVAGNIYVGQTVGKGADSDRKELARLTNQPLEELAQMAQRLIHKRKEVFNLLVSRIEKAFLEKMKDRNIQTGRHTLLTEHDLETIYYVNQPDRRFHSLDQTNSTVRASREMTALDNYVEEAMAHETGHTVVAKARGITVHEIYVMLTRAVGGYEIGDFATESEYPSDAEITDMPEQLKKDFILFISGGVAGNRFEGLDKITPGADTDREELKRFTDNSLEEVSEEALVIVTNQRRTFRQIRSRAKQKFRELMKNPELQTGRHVLLSGQELEAIFNKR
ncbi:MAG TPA: hypothetical protein VN982_15825 [Candidatus Dormibacteraeota bacterium]|nr:hypothetical protein [Candidatus Dormibacteraeota bacterium]